MASDPVQHVIQLISRERRVESILDESFAEQARQLMSRGLPLSCQPLLGIRTGRR